MATDVGARFVRRQSAARSNVSNTTAADFDYDTTAIDDGGYGTWTSAEVAVDTAGDYLVIHGTGEVDDSGVARSVGSNSVVLDGVTAGEPGVTSHRYVRISGGANEGVSLGVGMFDLDALTTVGSRVDGNAYGDAVGDFDVAANAGGGIQIVRLNDGDAVQLRRTSDQNVGTSNINTTRPWLDSSGTWTKVTWPTEDRDDGNWHTAASGDVVIPANTKVLITGNLRAFNTDASRSTMVARLNIDGTNVQYVSVYHRNTAGQGGYTPFMYLHETGGTSETLYLEATMECEGTDNGTMTVRGALQVKELPASAEWVHVDNSTTDTLSTALAGVTTWYTTTLSATVRADGNSDLSLDDANDAVQNDSGSTLPVLAIGWHNWDRDASSSTRKVPTGALFNNGSVVPYGWGGAYSRGAQSNDDTWHASYIAAATFDLANGQDLDLRVRDQASGANSNMGVYASGNRYFLGLQVLNLDTLATAAAQSIDVTAAAETETAVTVTPDATVTTAVVASGESEAAVAVAVDTATTTDVTAAGEVEAAVTVTPDTTATTAVGASGEVEAAVAITVDTAVTASVVAVGEVETPVAVAPVQGAAPQIIPVTATAEVEASVAVAPVTTVSTAVSAAAETETAVTVTPVGVAPTQIIPVTRLLDSGAGGVPHAVPAAIPASGEPELYSETETANPVGVTVSATIPVGAATETETAQAVEALQGATVTVTAAAETEAAGAVQVDITTPVGAATETETAGTVATGAVVTVTAATETEAAVAVTVGATSSVTVNAAAEVETAQVVGVGGGDQPVTVTQAAETEAANPVTVSAGAFAGWGIPIG